MSIVNLDVYTLINEFDIETLARLRFVCKKFNKCWKQYIKSNYLQSSDKFGYVVAANAANLLIKIVDIETMNSKQIICNSYDIYIEWNNDGPYTYKELSGDYEYLQFGFFNVTKNIIVNFSKSYDSLNLFKYNCLELTQNKK